MTGELVLERFRRFACFALALFSLALATAEIEHHDLACHLKTPQHCNACAAGQVGADPHHTASTVGAVLVDAGHAVCETAVHAGTILPARQSGRSPPVLS